MRMVWPILLLGVAVIAAAAQLDRQARRDPQLSPLVPGPARSFAQRHLAAEALAGNDKALALAEAQLLVQRRPVPAEHLRLLAQAQIAAGETEAAYRTIQQAARRGWRDRATQEAVLLIALEAGDDAEAARRLAALWVLDPGAERLPALAERVLESEEARETLAMIAADAPRWRARFLATGGRMIAPGTFADITARVEARTAIAP
ncbi:MAG: hypothetical protein A3J40_04370 [Erythrobacter sp. RIFCSPHIGHO2_12_FULL_63_10]|nr:MAG: hypothetical protein A3J40_04370 [Erythrobacter sp. RIFCSPHIGHO2_12_FULL_63_10]